MLDLKASAKIDVKMYVTTINGHYDFILGQDVLSKLGIVLDFEQQLVRWGKKKSQNEAHRMHQRNVLSH